MVKLQVMRIFLQRANECFEQIKKLVAFIPWNNSRKAESFKPKDPKSIYKIDKIFPNDPSQPYDVRNVYGRIETIRIFLNS